jgi:ferric-dicitrate binding protein FerR (iron transport regulator)
MAGRDLRLPTPRCERAQLWASLRLDGELSTVEEQLLERHLADCEACRAFEARIDAVTRRLRSAPAERPARRLRLPARGTFRMGLPRIRTALVAAAAVGLGALVGSFVDRPAAPVPEGPGSEVSYFSRDFDQLRQLPREEERTEPAPVPSGPPNPPEGVI